jgi:hypothetical protein
MGLKETLSEISNFQKFEALLALVACLTYLELKFDLDIISDGFSVFVILGVIFLFVSNITLRVLYKLTEIAEDNRSRIQEFYKNLLVGVTGGLMVSISGNFTFEGLNLSTLFGFAIEVMILSIIVAGSAYIYLKIPKEGERT